MRRINFSEGTTITTQVIITEVNSYYFAFTLSSKLNFFILGFGLGCQQKLASRCRGFLALIFFWLEVGYRSLYSSARYIFFC